MRIHAFMECSLVNGPGRRAVVWLQGCELGCSGCWNPATHARNAGTRIWVPALASRIEHAAKTHAIEGITFSGGEPMHQISEVLALASLLNQRAPQQSTGLFTGYTEHELSQGRFHTYFPLTQQSRILQWRRLRARLDFAVFGRYNEFQPVSLPLVTSRNQRLELFSNRYRAEDFAEQTLEVSIEADGLTQITGFPTFGLID